MSIVLFFAVLFVLILVHEWGHFIVAKKTGMQVDEFGIGFPPKLFGIKKGETEYTFNLLPIGGFVKILGEDGLIDNDQKVDQARSFTAKNRLAQAAVLVAGVTMNILFAWFLFVVVFMVGVQTTVDENTAGPDADLVIAEVLPDSPAAAAGLSPGAVVRQVSAGAAVLKDVTPSSFSDFTDAHQSEMIHVYVTESGVDRTIDIMPTTGLIANEPDRAAIGVALSMVEMTNYTWTEAIKEGTVTTFSTLTAIVAGVVTLIGQALTFSADLSQIAGPVGIVGLVGEAAAFGFTALMTFTAIISLNLAVINLLPIPALDGGRLLFVAVEAVRRRPIDPVWMARVNFVGFSLLILLMIVITINDVFYK